MFFTDTILKLVGSSICEHVLNSKFQESVYIFVTC